jgi:hypothetical protein
LIPHLFLLLHTLTFSFFSFIEVQKFTLELSKLGHDRTRHCEFIAPCSTNLEAEREDDPRRRRCEPERRRLLDLDLDLRCPLLLSLLLLRDRRRLLEYASRLSRLSLLPPSRSSSSRLLAVIGMKIPFGPRFLAEESSSDPDSPPKLVM